MVLSNSKNAKYESPFTIKILDDDYNLVTLINYDSLQWDRMYNTVGKFVIDGVTSSTNEYDRSKWKYVYTEKRKEFGRISQVNFKSDGNKRILTLSGLFVECDLNKMVCYTKPTNFDDDAGTHYGTSVLSSGSPQWVTSEGTADVVARAFFDGFKQINFRNYLIGDFEGSTLVNTSFELDIDYGRTESGVYNYSVHNRNNERLGDKLYDILQESRASVEVIFDYDNKTKTFNIIHGTDRTQTGHAQGVNPVAFSIKNGSIKQVSLVTSDTNTKDAVIQYSSDETRTLVLVNALPNSTGRFAVEQMSSSQSDFINDDHPGSPQTDKAHKLSVMADASIKLNDSKDVINIQFDFVSSSYKYMEDYDLGDVVSIDVPEVDISLDAQIVACHEVVKKGVWSMDIEIGKAILRKRGNI